MEVYTTVCPFAGISVGVGWTLILDALFVGGWTKMGALFLKYCWRALNLEGDQLALSSLSSSYDVTEHILKMPIM